MEEAIERYCRNCGEPLHGIYCSRCGQRDNDLFVPVKELISEFVAVLPLFDQRLWKTLRSLLFSPGALTTEYLSGKRKQYFSPFKLYFFITFLYFLIGSFTGAKDSGVTMDGAVKQKGSSDSSFIALSAGKEKGLHVRVQDSSEVVSVFGQRGVGILEGLKRNPQLFFDTFTEHRPKIIFLLLPAFAFLLKVLYVRRKELYVKHLVFAFHFHAFIFLILLLADVVDLLPGGWTFLLVIPMYVWIPLYLYRAQKFLYGQSRGKTMVKWTILCGGYVFSFLLVLFIASITILLLYYK